MDIEKWKEVVNSLVLRTLSRTGLAYLATIWAGAFLWKVTFTKSDLLNTDAKFIVGFVTGTIVSTIINFYFGTSQQSEDTKGEASRTVPEKPLSSEPTEDVTIGPYPYSGQPDNIGTMVDASGGSSAQE